MELFYIIEYAIADRYYGEPEKRGFLVQLPRDTEHMVNRCLADYKVRHLPFREQMNYKSFILHGKLFHLHFNLEPGSDMIISALEKPEVITNEALMAALTAGQPQIKIVSGGIGQPWRWEKPTP